ncbi:MAG: hypothetical protein AB4058_08095 [Microcystaceae cyanobacterium]
MSNLPVTQLLINALLKMSQEPLSSQEISKKIQETIDQLQQLVVKLDSEPVDQLSPPTVTTLDTLQETAQTLSLSLNPPKTEEIISSDNLSPEEKEQEPEIDEFDDFLQDTSDPPSETPSPVTQTKNSNLLSPLRSILPTGLNESLSDGILTGIVGGLLVALLVGAFFIISPQFNEETLEVADNPPIIETPVELESPDPPQAILVEPPPKPEISPEQRLIKAVQEDLADLTSRYPEGLIDGIEANFFSNRLIVILGEDWYQLRPSRQDDVAKGIFQKAKNLDFQKLELVNDQGDIIARSPVVGNKMIIFVRALDN